MTRWSAVLLGFAAFGAVLALAGCGTHAPAAAEAVPLLLTLSIVPEVRPANSAEGILEIDTELSGCVTLSGAPVVWPKGTTGTLDPPELRFGDTVARPGDQVSGDGAAWYGHDNLVRLDGIVDDDDYSLVDLCGAQTRQTVVFFSSAGEMRVR